MTIRNLAWAVAAAALMAAFPAMAEEGEPTDAAPALETKVSYAIGWELGQKIASEGAALDVEQIVAGLKAGSGGADPRFTEAEMQAAMVEFAKAMTEKAAAEAKANAAVAEEGQSTDDFLTSNKTKKGVKTRPSGLQYRVLRAGQGDYPSSRDTVRVHYVGKLSDGTVFDSSIERGEPTDLPLDSVVAGWREALTLMKVGSKWELVLPPDLAYGSKGIDGRIPPNSALVFEVELINIVK